MNTFACKHILITHLFISLDIQAGQYLHLWRETGETVCYCSSHIWLYFIQSYSFSETSGKLLYNCPNSELKSSKFKKVEVNVVKQDALKYGGFPVAYLRPRVITNES